MKKHIILEQISILKNAFGHDFESFKDLLEFAKNSDVVNEEVQTSLQHFSTVILKEQDEFIHLMYNKQYTHKNPWNEFLEESRSIVIDWKFGEIVLYPFSKFYELNEHHSTKESRISYLLESAKNTVFTLKIDGSLITSRYLNKKGEFLTVSSGSFNSYHAIFAQNLVAKTRWSELLKENPQLTFIFEMKMKDLPQNIFYNVDELVLIGARNMNTFEMLTDSELAEIIIGYDELKKVETFELDYENVLEEIKKPTFEHEGYVLDIDGFKVKLKSTNYILASRISSNHERNFKTLEKLMNEDRFDTTKYIINKRFASDFEKLKFAYDSMLAQKNIFLSDLLNKFEKKNLSERELVEELKLISPDFVKYFMQFKKYNNPNILEGRELKFLKNYSKFFVTTTDKKVSELFNLEYLDVVSKIKKGEIEVSESYDTPNGKVYMVNTFQFSKPKMIENLYKEFFESTFNRN